MGSLSLLSGVFGKQRMLGQLSLINDIEWLGDILWE